MASAHNRPEIGDTLLVIHAFQARSSDELTLAKGDKVELIERDDEFGDGWFLGRHLTTGNTGLFPEVYTRPAPKPTVGSFAPSKPLSPLKETPQETQSRDLHNQIPHPITPIATESPAGSNHLPPPSEPAPLSGIKSDPATAPPLSDNTTAARTGLSNIGTGRFNNNNNDSQDNQVLNDTLNVIDEHITHLRSAPSNSALSSIRAADSGSEYSAPLDRMSYIQGEETDEEEDDELDSPSHSRQQVEAWTVDQVAEYLYSVGVEKQHCDVFREQEISGDVLLGMDQSSLFIKAFDLGSVGRRLKTWHKIKSLQDETTGFGGVATRRTTQTYGSEVGSEDTRRSRGRTSTLAAAISSGNRQSSAHTRRLSSGQHNSMAQIPPPLDSPSRATHAKRPSAASARELMSGNRRHSSSTEYHAGAGNSPGPATPRLTATGTFPLTEGPHKKQPSFDRDWTLGHAFSQSRSSTIPPRPLSSLGMHDAATGSDPELQDSAIDLDRGYFSGTDATPKKRNVLKKLTGSSDRQTNRASYAEEHRVRSATALSRHSRFGSDVSQGSAAQKYYGTTVVPHRRTASTNTQESYRPQPPAKDSTSPTVTKLSSDQQSGSAVPSGPRHWFSSVVHKPLGMTSGGKRAISDSLGVEKKQKSPMESVSSKFSLGSPTRTESSTPSGAPSLELDSQESATSLDASAAATIAAAAQNKKMSRKTKKDTSAYTRGLLKIPPSVAIKEAEYSGWMRKKSSNLMTTWKSRFFVLSGRRLSYYYSEDDAEEKGLIDISFHRVLPADNERLTGLHATISGVVDRPNTNAPEELQKGDESVFIFKLVPPRAGLTKAVNFTKPTIHYFAVPNLTQGRLWMAALMKATIDRDDSQPLTTTYQQKTISLAKARQMRHRPPALMNLEEDAEVDSAQSLAAAASTSAASITTTTTNTTTTAPTPVPAPRKDANGLGIFGESDSGVSGVDKLASSQTDNPDLEAEARGSTPTPST